MYNKIQDFLNDWSYESESTIKIFENLTDESLDFKVCNEGRTVGNIAWHITLTISEMLSKIGLKFGKFDQDADYPKQVSKIIETYKSFSKSVSENISKDWSDKDLNKIVNMYGEEWANGFTLSVLILHQTHHRGQLTVLMRQAGLKVPSIYGPVKEEWEKMGLPTMR